ncbi:class I SAM-dependent methyltransferase [Sediminispirochaeta bajacaliforniensis]|uniref:class I SAM-dependent methyltransferase n=1 Tax=Sediminispirochaeta bajacaliforniensis TaxID=148 RepID=UPI0003797F97|nr:class I SAM-dependent methyltransferase [Sediminispirochaeta bajacaliforniensis]
MVEQFDWAKLWIEAQKRNIASGRRGECWLAWDDEGSAREYRIRSSQQEATQKRIKEICNLAKRDWNVLDIGAGPGTLAVPLSRSVAHITAVEPASGMAAVLEEEIANRGITNVTIIRKRWDDIDAIADLRPPYELCIASFSLGMLDVSTSIKQMMAVTKRHIVIYWHAGLQPWDRDAIELWPLLHGRPYDPIPKSDIVFNLLYSMGIYPDIRVTRSHGTMVFGSLEEALEQYSARFHAHSREKRAILIDFLKRRTIPDGKRLVMSRNHVGMRISWNMEDYHEA